MPITRREFAKRSSVAAAAMSFPMVTASSVLGALNSTLDLMPEKLTWDAETPVKPRPDGTYACATPGATKAW